MGINFQQSIVCKLGGHINSELELVISHPPIKEGETNLKKIINQCLPIGCKAGEVIEKKYNKNRLISYIFSIEKNDERDDLFSFSILLKKKQEAGLYKSILKKFIRLLDQHGLLSEAIFKKYQKSIYNSFNQEVDLEIENIVFHISEIFKEKRKEFGKSELDVRGSFF
ncbi:MAG: hypothetical protein GF383_13205 [Candidatus Lokiarchaeota archaeon]|nr:hypothetical protein [Candidatus Lokiarchaeota archaeon]MBD3342121.1 hypothetical protein [Candidatus Lokiarchaeota archaeon]